MSLLEIADYRLAFDGFEGTAVVLDGIDLAVEAGESVGIVGETGCGKSVLARSILRLNPAPPARILGGTIRFDGRDVLAMGPRALDGLRGQDIGMVFQDPVTYLNPVFTIGQQLADVLRAHDRARMTRRSRTELRARGIELLRQVRLAEPERQLACYPHALSGGMRQRVLIAMALAGQPRLLIADEPTTALDVTIQSQVLGLIADLVSHMHVTLLLISHDLGVIGAVCRRVAVMYAGRIVEDAPAERLFGAPRHPYTKGLLASVPDLERPTHHPTGIPGSIPNLRTPPSGCRFHPRCALAMPVCGEVRPEFVDVGERHRVACHAVAA
ncbi:MAG: ABC transporter ATP-binding protein [Acetobacteraceae bacterium]